MHRLNSVSTTLPPEILLLYSEQLNAKSSWFIISTENNQIILRGNSFDKLFACECNGHDLSLNSLPITQKSYDDLMKEVDHTKTSNLNTENLIALEMQCGKVIPVWISLQPIIINKIQIAILINAQLLDTPSYLTTMLKTQSINQAWNMPAPASDHTIRSKQISSQYTTQNNYKGDKQYRFSNTEQDVLNLILAGFSQKEICQKLNLSRTRVTQYISQICHKCGYNGYSGKYLKKHFNNFNTIT